MLVEFLHQLEEIALFVQKMPVFGVLVYFQDLFRSLLTSGLEIGHIHQFGHQQRGVDFLNHIRVKVCLYPLIKLWASLGYSFGKSLLSLLLPVF